MLRLQRKFSRPGRFNLSLGKTLNLLYPEPLPAQLRLDEIALKVSGSTRVQDLSAVRKILGALDGPTAPSPVHVRFRTSDVVEATVDGLRVMLDIADESIARLIIDGGPYEPEVSAVLQKRLSPGMTFVDVGANIGYHALLAAKLVGSAGRVIAIEPFSENCRLILMSVAANGFQNVTLIPVALGDHMGWSYFSTNIGSNASLIQSDLDQVARGYGFIVPTFCLDDIVTGPVDLLKIDIEGAEPRAVAGAIKLIERYRPTVISECSDAMLQQVSHSSLRDYLQWFVDRDYSVSILNRGGSEPLAVASTQDLLETWGDPFGSKTFSLNPGELSASL